MLFRSLYVIAMLKILITERTRTKNLKRQETISETYKSKLISVLLTDKDMSFYEVKDILNPNDNALKIGKKSILLTLLLVLKTTLVLTKTTTNTF